MATDMQVDEAVSWLYSYTKYGSKLGLERISILLNGLGNPHHSLQAIHVTGTNGKGSVCRFLGSILTHAGYKTGVYLSPHLEHFNERLIIDGKEIADGDLVDTVQKVKPVVESLEKTGVVPTFFEIVTAIAFVYFQRQKVDYVVVEVGLGGRFDATNVIQPLVSVITNISLEHTQYLGDDVTSVAFEKAGIIKVNAPVITAAVDEALLVIEAVATEKQVSVVHVSSDMWERCRFSLEYQEFHIKGNLKDYWVHTRILGEYQGENLAVAILTIEQLQLLGIFISDTDIVEGIAVTGNPGRMEVLAQNPLVVLDGAHNPTGMHMLTHSLKNDFQFNRLIVVMGILKDKNILEMLQSIVSIADEIVFTKSENPRACEPDVLAGIARKSGFKGKKKIFASLSDAVLYALKSAEKKDLVCITGSLFTVGEGRTYLLQNRGLLSSKVTE